MLGDLLTAIGRRKTIDTDTVEETKLNRVLTVFDLTALGVGATLGKMLFVKIAHISPTCILWTNRIYSTFGGKLKSPVPRFLNRPSPFTAEVLVLF